MSEHITEEQITDRYFATIAREICGVAEVCHMSCNPKCKAYKYAVRAYAVGFRKQNAKAPCDLCRYNPPSSGDGKPCTMCPACAKAVDNA